MGLKIVLDSSALEDGLLEGNGSKDDGGPCTGAGGSSARLTLQRKSERAWQKAKAKTSDLYSAQVKGLNPLRGDSNSRTDFAFISPDRQVVGVAGHRGNEVRELPIVVADFGRRFFLSCRSGGVTPIACQARYRPPQCLQDLGIAHTYIGRLSVRATHPRTIR